MEYIVELVEGAKRKEQYAITQLYVMAKDKALYIAKDMLKDEDEAQDVVQDAFIKAFDNLGSLERPEKFQGWLDTIVINRCRDLLRKKRPMLFTQLATDDENDASLQWEDTNEEFQPEASVDYAETRRLIKAMIDALPDPQRIATTLFYLEDMSVRDIAAFMGCSENTVKSRLNLARKNIKAQVLALEKKGTKLYCMPFIPFLYWMFKQEIAAVAAVQMGVAAGVGAAGAGGAGAGSVAAGAVGAGSAGSGAAGVGSAGMGTAGAGTAGAGGAGAGAAGTGTAGTGAAGAGTAATIAATAKGTGLGIAVKAAIAAVVVTAAVGAAVAVNHFTGQKTGANISKVQEEAPQWSDSDGQNAGQDSALAAAAVELNGEETEALKALYVLKDSRDPDEFLGCIMENRKVLFNLYNEKLGGGQYLFTGEVMENADTGTGVYIKDPNTVYVGDLAGGLPHGNGSLGRWFWGYNLIASQNCLSMGKAFSVLVGTSYQGQWSGGTAQGAGVNSQRGFQQYSGFDMGIYEQAREESCQGDYYADTVTSAGYVDGLVDGEVEYRNGSGVFSFNVKNGSVVLDDRVTQDEGSRRTRYYVTARDGEHKYWVTPDRVYKNSCMWDRKPSLRQSWELEPKGPLVQDWSYIEAGDDIREMVPFDDYPRFTADVLNYAIGLGYVTDLDMLSDNSDGFIFLDGEPVTTAEYIQFHFYVDSINQDSYPEFDFRYYFNGTNAGADGETAEQARENQTDPDLINQVSKTALQQFIASTWDAATASNYEEKIGNQLHFTARNATDGQKKGIVYLLACNSGSNWEMGTIPVEDFKLKLAREVYDTVLNSALGTSDNQSSWDQSIAEIRAYYPEGVGEDDSYLILSPGDYGMEWPAAVVEQTESLGNGLYKVSGWVGYIEEEGEIPEIPYEAVFKSNPDSIFMGLTLVTLTTNQ